MDRAYSLLEVKAVDDDARVITGIATTPTPDRMGDIVDPLGASFAPELPLLWQHHHDQPVGHVRFGKPTTKGIPFTATISQVADEGVLKARLDEAWQSVKARLVRAVSIGFRALEYAFMDDGGTRFIKTEIMELSLVTIPANAEATIQSIKAFDAKALAASGLRGEGGDPPGSTGTKSAKLAVKSETKATLSGGFFDSRPKEGKSMKTVSEQITAFKSSRETKSARMVEIMNKSAETGETLDAEISEEYDGLQSEVKAIDVHISRLESLQASQAVTAKAVDGSGYDPASASRSFVQVKAEPKLEPGISFARYALVLGAAKGNIEMAKNMAEAKFGNDTRLNTVLKAAVAAGTTTDAEWAGALVAHNEMTDDFITYLRPKTIIGQFGLNGVPALRSVPFNVHIKGQTAGAAAAWVGEGYAKPVTSAEYNDTYLGWAKIAAIAVVTEELLRFSRPNVDTLLRDDLASAVVAKMDADFINPAKAAGTGATASPASITNGVTAILSSGNDADAVRVDIVTLWATADTSNLDSASAAYVTDSRTVRRLVGMRNPLGNREFPGLTMRGGDIDGVPVIVSNHVPVVSGGSYFVLVFANEINLADDGVVTIDASREASIVMDTAPNMNSGTPTAAQAVSMYQTNSVAIRAERYINWSKRRASAVALLRGVNWGA
ncbi:phage major capsid protein [Asticcacaulis sp. ZE23SCel15]|uniref:phage major capsid protein n=1 Tax=Asticcacaulis sp. ZE23SCel15 TaxID=3059027 RepID=UPI00265E5DAA|nr:phage major capsid protein [Asticcacaulis sp. ZE23SCel15]WKL57248.1 phage major capsid protein [Asticcacaulis sp. ZE23SCel15]